MFDRPVLHRSRSIGTTRLYLIFSSSSTTAFELHTCTPQAKRHVARIAFAMVMLVTNSNYSWIILTITHHKTTTTYFWMLFAMTTLLRVIGVNRARQSPPLGTPMSMYVVPSSPPSMSAVPSPCAGSIIRI